MSKITLHPENYASFTYITQDTECKELAILHEMTRSEIAQEISIQDKIWFLHDEYLLTYFRLLQHLYYSLMTSREPPKIIGSSLKVDQVIESQNLRSWLDAKLLGQALKLDSSDAFHKFDDTEAFEVSVVVASVLVQMKRAKLGHIKVMDYLPECSISKFGQTIFKKLWDTGYPLEKIMAIRDAYLLYVLTVVYRDTTKLTRIYSVIEDFMHTDLRFEPPLTLAEIQMLSLKKPAIPGSVISIPARFRFIEHDKNHLNNQDIQPTSSRVVDNRVYNRLFRDYQQPAEDYLEQIEKLLRACNQPTYQHFSDLLRRLTQENLGETLPYLKDELEERRKYLANYLTNNMYTRS